MSSPMPSIPDLSGWLTDTEACARLGISSRTLDREMDAERLHPMKRPVAGRKPERVWDPEEIRARMPTPPMHVMRQSNPSISPALAESSIPPELGLMPADQMMPMIARLVEMVAEARQTPKPWITLKEAAEATGLSRKFLRRLIAHGSLEGVRDISIKVHRESLEELDISSELVKPAAKKKAPKKRPRR